MTPFEQAHQDWMEGKIQLPRVYHGDSELNPFLYQIAVHKYYLKLMSVGIGTKQVKLSDIKKFYGIKGKSAKDVYNSFTELIKSYNLNI
jgi:hypothetical protein